ncbi:MAG: hypothetical protein LBI10_11940 [Deltaproteobacteria bacterium]|jgi:outer membrane receptor for Fe3+-dicitrate|nr:hypothetical protein [Deltaproteobacteria bacterium]
MSKVIGPIILGVFFTVAAVLFWESWARSQETGTVEMGEIEVRGAIRREELESTSTTVLDNKDIADRIYTSPLYMLRQAPGVRVNEFNL